MTVTIVTDDAERLVREGGVVNRDEYPPDDLPQWWRHMGGQRTRRPHPPSNLGPCCEPDGPLPFTAEVYQRPGYDVRDMGPPVGTVRVVDVHHADDCRHYVPLQSYVGGAPEPEVDLCHPDAEPDKWHLTVEPIDQGDNDG